jgi:opacity protein-like surface antigen
MNKLLALTFVLVLLLAAESPAQVVMKIASPGNGGYGQAVSEPHANNGAIYCDQSRHGAGCGTGGGACCDSGGASYGMGCEMDCGADYGPVCSSSCGDCCGSPGQGCYIKVFGGWTQLEDFETQNQGFFVTGSFDDGYGLGAAWGQKVRPMMNLECEFTYRDNSAEQLTAQFQNGAPIEGTWDGDISSYSGMTNLIVESWRPFGMLTPYAGAGAGFGFVDASVSTQFGDYTIDDSGFAFQFIAGFLRPMSHRCDAFVEYRYFAIEDNRVENLAAVTVDDFDYRTQNIFFGLRLNR